MKKIKPTILRMKIFLISVSLLFTVIFKIYRFFENNAYDEKAASVIRRSFLRIIGAAYYSASALVKL